MFFRNILFLLITICLTSTPALTDDFAIVDGGTAHETLRLDFPGDWKRISNFKKGKQRYRFYVPMEVTNEMIEKGKQREFLEIVLDWRSDQGATPEFEIANRNYHETVARETPVEFSKLEKTTFLNRPAVEVTIAFRLTQGENYIYGAATGPLVVVSIIYVRVRGGVYILSQWNNLGSWEKGLSDEDLETARNFSPKSFSYFRNNVRFCNDPILCAYLPNLD